MSFLGYLPLNGTTGLDLEVLKQYLHNLQVPWRCLFLNISTSAVALVRLQPKPLGIISKIASTIETYGAEYLVLSSGTEQKQLEAFGHGL